MAENSPITQHVQDSTREESTAPSSKKAKKKGSMSTILAGRFLAAISKHSPIHPPNIVVKKESSKQAVPEDIFANDPRAQLFARLGIRSKPQKDISAEDIDLLIASLSHIAVEKRIEAAHNIADLYPILNPDKQMHARINLILMTWRDENTYARIASIEALAKIGTADVSEALQVAIRDEDGNVRAAAARALGKIQGEAAIVALIHAARYDSHWDVRASSIQSMGRLKERAFLNTIVAALDDEDTSVRMAAIHALVALEGLQTVPRLVLMAQREEQPDVRETALLLLERLGASSERHITAMNEKEQREEDV